ncbi:hypothetical protein BY458DRAFT_436615, partial [Sporodiniella umbellata]
ITRITHIILSEESDSICIKLLQILKLVYQIISAMKKPNKMTRNVPRVEAASGIISLCFNTGERKRSNEERASSCLKLLSLSHIISFFSLLDFIYYPVYIY